VPQIVYGWGALAHLKSVESRKTLILAGQGAMEELGILAEAHSYLEKAGARVEVVRGTIPEPPIEDVETKLELTHELQPDLIVALGGGSVIDSAKALWAFYEHPELGRHDLFQTSVSQPYPLPNIGQKAKLVAIPSTSGTGSETSGVAIMVEADTRVKQVLLSTELTPNMAIIDPAIASHMPPQITAHSGIDALTHALESVVSPWSNEFSEPLAMKALKLIFQNLRAAFNGSDRVARERMHYASTLAGMAINNSITGLAHGMDKIGLLFGIPHGLTCGVVLPYTILFNASEAKTQYAKIAKSLGLDGEDDWELISAFLKKLVELEKDVGIPQSFQEMGIGESQFAENVELVSEYVLKAGPTIFSPKVPSQDELKQLYFHTFHGDISNEDFI
jgi:alcohol dehydrogenase class IV